MLLVGRRQSCHLNPSVARAPSRDTATTIPIFASAKMTMVDPLTASHAGDHQAIKLLRGGVQ